VKKFSQEFSKHIEGLTPRSSIVLQRYGWPGNVRELEHVIGRACMLTDSEAIDVEDLPENLVQPQQDAHIDTSSALEQQERRLVEDALRASGGNQSEAARRLGIGRDALRYKMKRYELSF
jgi:transcriptional regulator with PAS, ATPase and Fis domain